ncbi:MAG: carbohydrate binding domain-containing protein [Spirochaetes bacterium]|nr:carbohydrate binding domain-containing protein [Spirochaetota bacterium]
MKLTATLCAVMTAACITGAPLCGITYHVAVNGSDANPGTAQAPFRSIQKGADTAQPGDTVFVHEGVYRERVSPPRGGESDRPIVYMAEPGKNVVIKGSDIWKPAWENDGKLHCAVPDEAMFTDDCYHDDKNPFRVEMSSTPFGRDGRREFERKFVTETRFKDIVFTLGQVYVNGRMYRQVPLKNEANDETGTWWYDRSSGKLYVHFAGNPSTKTVEILTRRRVFAPHRRGLGYIHVIGFVMEHSGNNYPTNFWEKEHREWQQAGILGTRSGHHWRIERNVFRLGMVGIDVGFESLADQSRGDIERGENGKNSEGAVFHEIVSNHIVDIFGPGTAGSDARGIRFIGNIIERNNTLGFAGMKRFETAGIKLHRPDNARIIGNLFRSNACAGLWLDQGSGTNTIIARNIFIGNRQGFDLEIGNMCAASCLLAYNVFIGNTHEAVSSRESGGLVVMNNFIAGSEYGYRQSADVKRDHGKKPPWSWTALEHWCYGNIFTACGIAVAMLPPGFSNRPDLIDGRRFDGNVYGTAAGIFKLGGEKESIGFDVWREKWNGYNKGSDCETKSAAGASIDYAYDDASITLTLRYDAQPMSAVYHHEKVTAEVLGGAEGNSAGPFRTLTRGENVFPLWKGVRPLAEYELPYGGSELVTSPDDALLLPSFNPDAELIVNGGFAGMDGWTAMTTGGAKASFSADKVLAVVTEKDGGKEWDIQVKQDKILIERGTYVFSFKARADAPRRMKAAVIQDALPQPQYCGIVPDITSDWKEHRGTFTMSVRQTNARVQLRFATYGTAAVQVRNVSLKRIR